MSGIRLRRDDRLRLAFVGPLPPDLSGIADYGAELLPALAELAAVTVYPEGELAADLDLGPLVDRRPLDSLPGDVTAGGVDRVLYQLGNSAASHSRTFGMLMELPGTVVLHEYLLHHLVREMALAAGDLQTFAEELRYCAGPTGAAAARALLDEGREPDPWAFPLFERVVDRSSSVLVHSEFARRRILESRPLARVGVVPMPCALPASAADPAAARSAARRRLGLPQEVPLLASFGFVTPQKHLEPALAAFARLRRDLPEARYLLVGEVSPYYDLDAALAHAAGGGDPGVTVTGRVSLETLHDAMAACDVAVNLRHPTGGESSATLVRLLALGRAVVVSEAGSFAELPRGCAVQVPVDELEEAHLFAIFRRLLHDRELREALGANAARFAAAQHRPERTARRILEEVARVDGAAPRDAVPPLAPHSEDALEIRLAGAIAAELADLTLGEEDEVLLAELAGELVGLDLDLPFLPGGGS